MPDDYLAEIFAFAKPIAAAIEKAFPCNRCGLSVVGIEVPHAHMHLVPLNTANDLNFTKKKLSPTPEEMEKTKEKLLKAMQ
jgi:histidine triad (HIT) family protein